MASELLTALISNSGIVELITTELSAKRNDASKELTQPNKINVSPNYTLTTAQNAENTSFLIKLALDVVVDAGSIRCEVAATYNLIEGTSPKLDTNLLVEYANEVALMTLLPFLRQHLADMSQRVFGFPLLMPIVPRGSLVFSLPDY